jgi:hypothetical protein
MRREFQNTRPLYALRLFSPELSVFPLKAYLVFEGSHDDCLDLVKRRNGKNRRRAMETMRSSEAFFCNLKECDGDVSWRRMNEEKEQI